MINNFEQIKKLLTFESEDDFYLLQILRRKKENPDVGNKPNVVKTYYINSIEYLDKVTPEIIGISNERNARAYITINRRSFKKTALKTLQEIVNNIESGNYKAVRKAYESSAGKYPSEKDKKWIIDIDWKDFPDNKSEFARISAFAQELMIEANKDPFSEPILTKNGIHIITRPFNLEKFREKYPTVEVHKDRYTILYIS
jgi:predicted type IV restriction endonuclease